MQNDVGSEKAPEGALVKVATARELPAAEILALDADQITANNSAAVESTRRHFGNLDATQGVEFLRALPKFVEEIQHKGEQHPSAAE